jgi:uncharacterized protein (TIGR04255 family)
MPAAASEEFFMRLGAALHVLGYSQAERQLPPDVPVPAHRVVYRFRSNEDTKKNSLYQVGPGVFTANAVPPYKSWDTFAPVVRDGVTAMLSARSHEEAEQPFDSVSLRYIDHFGPNLTQGKDVTSFMADVLDIRVDLPRGLTMHLAEGSVAKPAIQVHVPMNRGMVMSIAIGEGIANGKHGIIMDTSVATAIPVVATIDAIMDVLNSAHDAIRASFVALIAPIDHLMPTKEANS